MSADLLRRAADKLRKQAEQATPGPWKAEDDGLVWPDRMGDPVSGSMLIDDANYIETLHPPVALALADLLVGYAEIPPFAGWDGCHGERLVAVAREVLREVTS